MEITALLTRPLAPSDRAGASGRITHHQNFGGLNLLGITPQRRLAVGPEPSALAQRESPVCYFRSPASHQRRRRRRNVQSDIVLHCRSPSLRGHMRLTSYIWRADSLALVWLDPGITPCCKSLFGLANENSRRTSPRQPAFFSRRCRTRVPRASRALSRGRGQQLARGFLGICVLAISGVFHRSLSRANVLAASNAFALRRTILSALARLRIDFEDRFIRSAIVTELRPSAASLRRRSSSEGVQG
jgi:hypothetical protein